MLRRTVLTATMATLSLASPAAAAKPGDLCQIGNPSGAEVMTASGTTGGVGWYTLPFGAYFRIEAYGPLSLNGKPTYRGHGTNKPTGITERSNINQATCH